MSPLPNLPAAIERAAARAPDAEGVRCGSDSLTWSELWTRAGTLAAHLADLGVARGDRVGVLMDKSVEMVVALHGIMRAGAAWVPLDPKAPAARHAFQIRDCGMEVVVSHPAQHRALAALAAEGAAATVVGADPGVSWDLLAASTASPPDRRPGRDDLAYIIYTSGSTGTPKGIQHTHGSGLAYCECTARLYDLGPEDRVSNQAPLHFDIAIFDLFSSAVAAAPTILIPDAHLRFPASLSQLLADERISVFFTVPFALTQLQERGVLEDRDLSALRLVIFGGEVMPTPTLRALMARLPHVRFHNMYGPAEVNGCTGYDVPRLDPHDDRPVPIGRTFPGMTTLVRGPGGEVLGPGTPGELLVAGPTQMVGYWNRPDLDERAFWIRPEDGLRYYRTGDLVERLPDGNHRFLGRADRQVKSRGYRIELDEVEAALQSHPSVVEAAVYALPHEGTQRLVGAVQLREEVEVVDLKAWLRDRIPPYAVPEVLTPVEGFPRNSNGKIDYLALRERDLA